MNPDDHVLVVDDNPGNPEHKPLDVGAIMSPRPASFLVHAMATCATGLGLPAGGNSRHTNTKREATCALPTCQVKTTHNGGYCCADHCRKHREMRRVS